MNTKNTLKSLLNTGKTLIMPNAFDPISAKIIEYVGFSAVQCSGYSFSIEKGFKSENDIDLKTNLRITKEIIEAVNIPVMADGEDGYGDSQVIADTVNEFINIGASGINIEDQNQHSENGAMQIIDENSMLDKLKTAIKAKNDAGKADFIINSRTDALLSSADRNKAIKVAVERANKYLDIGADLCFIPYVKTLDEVRLLSKEVKGPISIAAGLPYNIKEFSINDCIDLGIARVSLPSFLIFSAMNGMLNNLKKVKDHGSFDEVINDGLIFSDMCILKDILNIKN